MIVFGKRIVRIKKYDDYNIKCENCGNYEQRFLVYQDSFHVMFIPFFPLGNKTVKCFCKKCNDRFNQEKKNHYLSVTRTPAFMYLGIILFVTMIASIIILVSIDQKKEAEYIRDPKVGDVYLCSKIVENSPTYYFLKIKNINGDTIEFLHSALQYYGTTPTMLVSDHFVKNEKYQILKKDLICWKDSGYIRSVDRDYGLDSRYRIEK